MLKVRNAKLEYDLYLRNMTDEQFADYMLVKLADVKTAAYQSRIIREAALRLKDEVARPVKVKAVT